MKEEWQNIMDLAEKVNAPSQVYSSKSVTIGLINFNEQIRFFKVKISLVD